MEPDASENDVEQFVHEGLRDFYPEIGRIASVWAMLEFRMDQLIWYLLDVEQTFGACITTQINGPSPRLRALKTLIELRGNSPTIITKLTKFSHKIWDTQEQRNRTIHDPWFIKEDGTTVEQMRVATIENKIVYKTVPVTLIETKSIYAKSLELLKEFNYISEEIRKEPFSSLIGKQRKRLFRANLRGEAKSSQGKRR